MPSLSLSLGVGRASCVASSFGVVFSLARKRKQVWSSNLLSAPIAEPTALAPNILHA